MKNVMKSFLVIGLAINFTACSGGGGGGSSSSPSVGGGDNSSPDTSISVPDSVDGAGASVANLQRFSSTNPALSPCFSYTESGYNKSYQQEIFFESDISGNLKYITITNHYHLNSLNCASGTSIYKLVQKAMFYLDGTDSVSGGSKFNMVILGTYMYPAYGNDSTMESLAVCGITDWHTIDSTYGVALRNIEGKTCNTDNQYKFSPTLQKARGTNVYSIVRYATAQETGVMEALQFGSLTGESEGVRPTSFPSYYWMRQP